MSRSIYNTNYKKANAYETKYIAEKTTIPLPRLHGYSVNRNNILNLPFMLVEYVEGKSLQGIRFNNLEKSTRNHLFSELADIYLQFYQQRFDKIGLLTLDENDENWVFASNRPLNVDINDQQAGNLDICRYLPPNQTFTSTIDYVYFIIRLLFNDFHRGPDSIMDEGDARCYLYSIHASQGVLTEWVRPEYNHGPSILIHGDFRPSNIIIDDDFNILSILDWEWSHTFPAQLLVPPSWLTNLEAIKLGSAVLSISYDIACRDFMDIVANEVCALHMPDWDRSLSHF